jgi:hypothetical protein
MSHFFQIDQLNLDCLNVGCSSYVASNNSFLENSTLVIEDNLQANFRQNDSSMTDFGPRDEVELTLPIDSIESMLPIDALVTTLESDSSILFVRDQECQFNRSNTTCDAESKFLH